MHSLRTNARVNNLQNRKGGIGKVTVFINGAEVVEDLRSNPKKDSIQTSLKLTLNLNRFKNRFDILNQISVVAYNGEGWLSGRPQTVSYKPFLHSRGENTKSDEEEELSIQDVHLQAVIVGTSNLGLHFAHKDAQQMALSLSLVASELVGLDKTTIQLLITQDGTQQRATKSDIIKALTEAQLLRPQDVFVLYLAGHGISYGEEGKDNEFYYLTAGATQANAEYLKDPSIRQNYTISSKELAIYLNIIPAKKKVLILDVCAAGKGAELLTLAARKVPTSQIRALDRLRDRTGFYILAGVLTPFGEPVLTGI